MLDDKQKAQLEKFKTISGWMYGDTKLANEAQFLVALGLFNYIETLGAFLIGYFQKDNNGQIKKCNCQLSCPRCKNGQIRTSSKRRFRAFFSHQGQNYKELSDEHPEFYDEMRCGLTHEFLPKNRKFSIAKIPGAGIIKSTKNSYRLADFTSSPHSVRSCPYVILCQDETMDVEILESKITQNFDGSAINCGIVFFNKNNEEIWQVLVPNLRLDFEIAVKKLIKEVEAENDKKLINNFFEAADNINLENFTNN